MLNIFHLLHVQTFCLVMLPARSTFPPFVLFQKVELSLPYKLLSSVLSVLSVICVVSVITVFFFFFLLLLFFFFFSLRSVFIFLSIQAQALGLYSIFHSVVTKPSSKFLSLDPQTSRSFHPHCLDLLLHISASAWRNCCVGSHVVISLISFTCSMTLRVPLDVCRLTYTLQGPSVLSLRHVMEHSALLLTTHCTLHALQLSQCVFTARH